MEAEVSLDPRPAHRALEEKRTPKVATNTQIPIHHAPTGADWN
jgi:hypothetical protein